MLLKRTTATAAARTFPSFLDRFPDITALACSAPGAVEDALKPVGLYKQRSRSFVEMATHIRDREGGRFPRSLKRLKNVPGLGDYSSRAVLCFVHGRRTAIVDSNVERIIRRLFSAKAKPLTTSQVQLYADSLVPAGRSREFNWAMLDLAASICRYDRARCERCPLAKLCDFSINQQGA
jgi:A/G-specific adenine glycosylase